MVRQREGYYQVRTGAGPRTEGRDDDQQFAALRGQLQFTGAVDLRLIADYSKRDENCCAAPQLAVGPTLVYMQRLAPDGGIAAKADPWARIAYSNRNTTEHIKAGGVSAELNADLGARRLTSVTGWRRWEATLGQDYDFSTVDMAYRPDDGSFSNRFTTFSQELRLAGQAGHLDWLVGGYYQHETLDCRDRLLYGAAYESYLSLLLSGGVSESFLSTNLGRPAGSIYASGQGLRDVYNQTEESFAISHGTWRVGSRLDLTMGLRYTDERKQLAARYDNSDGGVGCSTAITRSSASVARIAPAPKNARAHPASCSCPTSHAVEAAGRSSSQQRNR